MTGKRLQAANKKRRLNVAEGAAVVPHDTGASAQSRAQAFFETSEGERSFAAVQQAAERHSRLAGEHIEYMIDHSKTAADYKRISATLASVPRRSKIKPFNRSKSGSWHCSQQRGQQHIPC